MAKNSETFSALDKDAIKLALKVSKVGTWQWDVDRNELTWSSELKEIFKLKKTDEISYDKYRSLLHPDDVSLVESVINDALKNGKEYAVEHRIIWPNKTIHWVLSRGKAVYKNGKPECMVGTAVNIDSRKKDEQELYKNQSALKARHKRQTMLSELGLHALSDSSLQSSMDKAVVQLMQTLGVDYAKVLELLPGGEHMVLRSGLGWNKDIRVNQSTVDTGKNSQAGYTLASKHPVIVKDLTKEKRFTGPPLLKKHKVISGMSCIIHGKDGPYGVLGVHSKIYQEFNADDINFLQSVANVLATAIQRKQTESKLLQTQERFRHVADNAPVLIRMSSTDKLCHYFNQPWLDFTGRTEAQESGVGWQTGIHDSDKARFNSTYNSAFKQQKNFCLEFRLRRHDGVYRWVLNKGTPRYNSEGKFLGYISTSTDIDELKSTKQSKKELETINKKLKQQQQQLKVLNNAKDEFISIASHQLRTPATSVKQYLSLLMEGYAGDITDKQRSLLEVAYNSNERELLIIKDLLYVAQLDGGNISLRKKKIDVVSLVQEVVNDLNSKSTEKLQKLGFKANKNESYVVLDRSRMRMVLENLIDNAIKYSPEQKSVTITLTCKPSSVTIAVADQGYGISKSEMPKLFQKFSRLEAAESRETDGTGLGLYWAKKIVNLHKGDLSVQSQPGKGSTFTVALPKTV